MVSEEYNWEKRRILIVEDTEHALELIEEIIAGTNASYISVKTGKQALSAIEENQDIDLVLLDIQLPDISGYEVAKEIKKKYPGIYIIAQTAYGMSEDKKKAFDAGCDDYIAKPIEINEFLSKIDDIFRK